MDNGKLRDKVKKLLALSTSPNKAEAEAAMCKAQKLMAEYNINLADLKDQKYIEKELQTKYCRLPKHYTCIILILQNYFNVKVLFTSGKKHEKAYLYFNGTCENVDIAVYLYHYLVRCFENLYKIYKKNTPWAHKKSYMLGVYQGLDIVLSRQKESILKEVDNSRVLIVIKDKQLDKFVDDNNPNLKNHAVKNGQINPADAIQGISDGHGIKIHSVLS